jgi:hypothetical protein
MGAIKSEIGLFEGLDHASPEPSLGQGQPTPKDLRLWFQILIPRATKQWNLGKLILILNYVFNIYIQMSNVEIGI